MLLPSDELKQLHQKVPICLSGRELPGNCDIRFGQFYYFFMFNAEGELTDVADMSNGLTKRVQKGMTLPLAFLDMVEASLLIKTSLDDCERAYLDAQGSAKAPSESRPCCVRTRIRWTTPYGRAFMHFPLRSLRSDDRSSTRERSILWRRPSRLFSPKTLIIPTRTSS